MLAWQHQGYMAVKRDVFDIGMQTSRALNRIARGVDPADAGGKEERDNGNGSLMRVLPLALWHQGDRAELVRLAHRQSLPTHGHVRSQVCCALYCIWAQEVMQGATPQAGWIQAISWLKQHYQEEYVQPSEYSKELNGVIYSTNSDYMPTGSGYVVDCLHSAQLALNQSDFASVIRAAIRFGNDTDTTACVAGGIAGIYFGLSGIPAHWKAQLRGQDEWLNPLLTQWQAIQ